VKKYSLHFLFLILSTGLIILGACGSGDIIDVGSIDSDDYVKMDEARINLVEEGGLIAHCGSGEADIDTVACGLFRLSSAEVQESSSSEEEEVSSSSEEESSSSEEVLPSSSSSSLSIGQYVIPSFKCFWEPSAVKSGSTAKVMVEFDAPNPVADAECEKEAWIGVDIPNALGIKSGLYDTSYFTIGESMLISGKVLESRATWPLTGEFASDVPISQINPQNLPFKIVGTTVTCENLDQGKIPNYRVQDCEPLLIGDFVCNMTATTGIVGLPISPAPTASCNNVPVLTGLTWTPADLTPTAAGPLVVSVNAVSGDCRGMAATCSSVTVTEPAFECDMAATTGTVGVPISPAPVVTCNGTAVTTGLAWTPANLTPIAWGPVPVSVTASSGLCTGKTATCGSVTVPKPPFICTMTATIGEVGVAISPTPVVTCNDEPVTTALTWTPANLIPEGTGTIPVTVTAGSGSCSGETAPCGDIIVPKLTCNMTAASGTVGLPISPAPTASCNGTPVTTGLTWTPTNLTPTVSGPLVVTVSAGSSSGLCAGKSATCTSIPIAEPAFECAMTAETGRVGDPISPAPTASCNGTPVTTGLTWTPENLTPATSGPLAVKVSASSGVCKNMTANCGNITVSKPTFTCLGLTVTGYVGEPFLAPTVRCNGTNVTSGLEWIPENRISTVIGEIQVSVSASSGVCSGEAVNCGFIDIIDVPQLELACSGLATTGTVGVPITAPTVKCEGTTVPSTGLTWTSGLTPTTAGNFEVSANVTSGACSGRAVSCGTVIVSEPVLACTGLATTGTVNVPLTAPTVTCNSTPVSSTDLTWTPANLTPTTTGTVPVSANVGGTGICSGKTVSCGSVTVSDVPVPVLACTGLATTGTVNVQFAAPTVTCNGTATTTGLTWTPANRTPTVAGSVPVSVTAGAGSDCGGQTASCGNMTVSEPTFTCTGLATTGTVGVQFAAPTVTCNGTATTTGLTWTPANRTPTTTGTVPVSVTAGAGSVCNGKTVSCGNMTVSAPPACNYLSAWCGGITLANVSIGEVPRTQSAGAAACYFVTNIGATQNIYGQTGNPVKVNGDDFTGQSYKTNPTLPAKVDGGYYIYIPSYSMFDAATTPATARCVN